MHPFRFGIFVSILGAGALTACGARSSLSLPEDGSAGGGSTSSTTNSSGGSGAGNTGGNGSGECSAFVVDGPPLSPLPENSNDYQFIPWLAATEPDTSQAAFVYLEHYQSAGEFIQVASVALHDPWGTWPASLGTSTLHNLTDGFVVGPAQAGKFSMLTTDEPKNSSNDPAGMVVWAPSADIPGAEGQFFDDIPPGFPSLVTSNDGRYLAGFQRQIGDLYHFSMAEVSIGPGAPGTFSEPVTCAIQATLSGAAIPLGKGYLAALSNGRPYAHCLTDDLADGPPSRLQIVRMPDGLAKAEPTLEYDELDTYIYQVRLTPSQDGAWAAWERIAWQPPLQRRIQLLQLDASGAPVNGNFIEVNLGIVGVNFALAALGARPVIATLTEKGTLGVYLLNTDGSLAAETSLPPDSGFGVDAGVALLASPAGDQLLVGWAESSAINNDARRVRLARLGCADQAAK